MLQSSKLEGAGRRLSIKAKFVGLVVGATFVSCLAVGLLSYQIGKSGLIEASKMRLESAAGNQSKQLAAYQERVSQSLADLAQNTAIGQAVETMSNIIPSEADSIRAEFQKPGMSVSDRAGFDGAALKLLYAVHHSAIHGTLASAWKNSRVSDIYVIDNNGQVVYSVTKGSELLQPASNLPQINELLKQIQATSPDAVHVSEFVPYQPDGNKPSVLIGKQLAVASWGKTVTKGSVIFRISAEQLTGIVTPDDFGKSIDEAVLLDGKGAFRSGSFANGISHDTPAELAKAAAGQTSGSEFVTAGDRPLFFAYQPVTLFGKPHLLAIGQGEGQVLAAARSLAIWAVLATVAVLVGMGGAGTYIAARLTRPLTDLAKLMNRLNEGDKAIVIASASRGDEIGVMARALESFRQGALDKERMEE